MASVDATGTNNGGLKVEIDSSRARQAPKTDFGNVFPKSGGKSPTSGTTNNINGGVEVLLNRADKPKELTYENIKPKSNTNYVPDGRNDGKVTLTSDQKNDNTVVNKSINPTGRSGSISLQNTDLPGKGSADFSIEA